VAESRLAERGGGGSPLPFTGRSVQRFRAVVDVRPRARILAKVVDKDFPTAGQVAASLAPVNVPIREPNRGEHPLRGGNKVLKRVLFLSTDGLCTARGNRRKRSSATRIPGGASRGTLPS